MKPYAPLGRVAPVRLPLLVVATLLAAGCVQETAQTAGLDVPGLPVAPPLARVVSVVDPEGGQGEPSLGVAPDGTLYTNGPARQNNVRTGGVYRSLDGGASWERVATPTLTPDFDPDLAVDVDGTIWFDTLWLGCSSAASSRDGGETWTSSPLACVPPAGDRQYIIPTRGGTAYIYAHSLPTFYQMVAKTEDYGRTWVPLGSAEGVGHHLLLGKGSGWGGGGFWNPVTDSVFFTYSWFDGDKWFPAASVTRDGGKTWEVVKATTAGGASVGLSLVVGAADDAGNVYLAWAESLQDGKDMAVFFASSTDDGRTWSAPKRVDDGTGSKVFPAITARAPGRVAIAYYESDEAAYPASVTKDAAWNVTLAWTTDALADAPLFERGALSNQTARHGAICPDGAGCSSDRQFLDYFALKTMPDGRVASVWTSTDAVEGKTVNVFGATDLALLAE